MKNIFNIKNLVINIQDNEIYQVVEIHKHHKEVLFTGSYKKAKKLAEKCWKNKQKVELIKK